MDKTGCVSVQGNRYEVDAHLVGRQVQLRYDPFDLTVIQVWFDGRRFPNAYRINWCANTTSGSGPGPSARPNCPPPASAT